MHRTAIVNYGITSEQFYDMTIAEFQLLLEQYKFRKQQRKIDLLDHALYISCLVLNAEAEKTYDHIYNSIINPDDNTNKTDYSEEYKKQQQRINEILIAEAKRKGLKIPNEGV
jgi:hypothetical protein